MVILLVKKIGRGMPGSIENPTCRILIQQMARRGGNRGKATVRGRRKKKEAEEKEERTGDGL